LGKEKEKRSDDKKAPHEGGDGEEKLPKTTKPTEEEEEGELFQIVRSRGRETVIGGRGRQNSSSRRVGSKKGDLQAEKGSRPQGKAWKKGKGP